MVWKRASQELSKASTLLNENVTRAVSEVDALRAANTELSKENASLKLENTVLKEQIMKLKQPAKKR